MAGLAIVASDFAANAALRGYLISQVDNQLINISSSSLTRLDRAGIAPAEIDQNDSPFKILAPLSGVPTATSVTLLDIDGNLIGQAKVMIFLLIAKFFLLFNLVVGQAEEFFGVGFNKRIF